MISRTSIKSRFTTAPSKVRDTANSRKAREGPQVPLPPTRRPRQSAEPITQRFPLRTEVPLRPIPVRSTLSARLADTNPSNSAVRRINNMVEPQGSNAEEPVVTGRSSQKSMPLPGSRGAPFFDKSKPIELLRFIDQMEDLFEEYGIRDDQEKKKKLGKYADQQTEFEWKAFNEFDDTSTFVEFKKALIDDYPDAQMAGKGTLTALKKVCKENSKLLESDYAELKALTRSFRAQQKLLMTPPVLVSNRELVDMFLGCLRESFASQVRSSLNIEQTRDRKQKDKENTSTTRRPEDPYEILDVIDMAETIAGRLRGGTREQNVLTRGEALPVQAGKSLQAREHAIKMESDELDEIRNLTANIADNVKIEQKQNSEFRSIVQNTQIEMKKLLETLAQQHQGVSNPQTKHATYKMTSEGCWYCEETGHFAMTCPHREEHINQKKIKLLGNKLYFFHNNTAVPRGTSEKTVRMIVEETCRQLAVMQNNMFAEPGEVYKQESAPGILRIPDTNNGNEFSVFTNQMRDKRDDVILNMNNQVIKLTEILTNLIASPEKAKDVDVSQFAVTRRSQTETQGQQGK